jgi:hypothetical protein
MAGGTRLGISDVHLARRQRLADHLSDRDYRKDARMTLQVAVDQAVRAVCPIHGVSFGSLTDKTKWRIDFKDEATTEQRAAASAVVAGFDPASVSDKPEPTAADVIEVLKAKGLITDADVTAAMATK